MLCWGVCVYVLCMCVWGWVGVRVCYLMPTSSVLSVHM